MKIDGREGKMFKKLASRKKKTKGCEQCDSLIPIMDGDYFCTDCGGEPKMVICNHIHTDEYLACGGRHFVER